MTQGKRISADIGDDGLHAIRVLEATARLGRSATDEGQTTAATRLDLHIRAIGHIKKAGAPGVAIGHVPGLLAFCGIDVRLPQPEGR